MPPVVRGPAPLGLRAILESPTGWPDAVTALKWILGNLRPEPGSIRSTFRGRRFTAVIRKSPAHRRTPPSVAEPALTTQRHRGPAWPHQPNVPIQPAMARPISSGESS
jgi:hypothetical protein